MKTINTDTENMYEDLKGTLTLPVWLYYDREEELLIHAAINRDNVIRIKETISQFHNLYDTIESARFNLLTSYNQQVIEELTNDENDASWVKIQFINNAIQWYNNSFDILLQSLWIYYGIYGNNCKTRKALKIFDNVEVTITTKTLPEILKSCNYNSVREWVIAHNSPLTEGLVELHCKLSRIHHWANIFKHRGNIAYSDSPTEEIEVKTHSVNAESKVWYNSTRTKESVSISQCVEEIINYHRGIIEYSKKITEEFKLYFRANK